MEPERRQTHLADSIPRHQLTPSGPDNRSPPSAPDVSQTRLKRFFDTSGSSATRAAPVAQSRNDVLATSYLANACGNISLQRNHPLRAFAHYSEAIAKNPRCPEFYSNRAAVYFSNGEIDKSIADCMSALAIDPAFVPAILRLALAHWSTGRGQVAIAELENGLKLNPAHPLLLHNLQVISAGRSQPPPLPVMQQPLALLQKDKQDRTALARGPIPDDDVIENRTRSPDEPGFDPAKLVEIIHSLNGISDMQGGVPWPEFSDE
jgi:tetratricopeptide (TPR) repeat protein